MAHSIGGSFFSVKQSFWGPHSRKHELEIISPEKAQNKPTEEESKATLTSVDTAGIQLSHGLPEAAPVFVWGFGFHLFVLLLFGLVFL